MFVPLLHHSEDLWLLNHKITIDGINKLIIVNSGVNLVDVKVDIYSSWKEWLLLHKRQFNKFEEAIRTIGGDPTVFGQFAGDIYFLKNGWRLQRKASVGIIGSLFSDDFDTPSIDFENNSISLSVVSSLVTAVKPSVQDLVDAGIPTADDIATSVWSEAMSGYATEGTAGNLQETIVPAAKQVAAAVWDEPMVDYTTVGTAGALQSINSATASEIADTVLQEVIADHAGVSGSLAEAVTIIKGLVQSNFVLDSTNYTGDFLTSARIRIFSTGAEVAAATDGASGQGEIATFIVSAETEGAGSTDTKIYKVRST